MEIEVKRDVTIVNGEEIKTEDLIKSLIMAHKEDPERWLEELTKTHGKLGYFLHEQIKNGEVDEKTVNLERVSRKIAGVLIRSFSD